MCMIKHLFYVFLRMAVLLRIQLAHSSTPGLGDYMCCVHVKASKPSPLQSWSDCTIIPLTLSSTPLAMRPQFSQDAVWLLLEQQSSALPAKVIQWVNLSACLFVQRITVDPLAHHQLTVERYIYIYISLFRVKRRNGSKDFKLLLSSLHLNPTQAGTHANTYTAALTQTHICNFMVWIEDPEARSTVQGRTYPISRWQLLTLTYRLCITFQYCTEVCRRRTADTSKGCSEYTLLVGASQLCRSRSCSRPDTHRERPAMTEDLSRHIKKWIHYFQLGWVEVIRPAFG